MDRAKSRNGQLVEPACFDSFLKYGYLHITAEDVAQRLGPEVLADLLRHVRVGLQKGSGFFAQPEAVKIGCKSQLALDEGRSYYPGFWPASSYEDNVEGVDFLVEYLFSRDYFSSSAQDFFLPFTEAPLPEQQREALPNSEGYAIGQFLEKHVFQALRGYLTTYLGAGGPVFPERPSIQLLYVFYEDDSLLDWHQDKGFIMGILGPADNIVLKGVDDGSEQRLELAEGDILVHVGLQFESHFVDSDRPLPRPIPHKVEAYARRMSLVLNSFARASETMVF